MDAQGQLHDQGHRRVVGRRLHQDGRVGPPTASLLRPHARPGHVAQTQDEAGQQAPHLGATLQGGAGDARLGQGEPIDSEINKMSHSIFFRKNPSEDVTRLC